MNKTIVGQMQFDIDILWHPSPRTLDRLIAAVTAISVASPYVEEIHLTWNGPLRVIISIPIDATGTDIEAMRTLIAHSAQAAELAMAKFAAEAEAKAKKEVHH